MLEKLKECSFGAAVFGAVLALCVAFWLALALVAIFVKQFVFEE